VHGPQGPADTTRSSVVYDAVAVTLLPIWEPGRFLESERLRVTVSDKGFTRPNATGSLIAAGVRWRNIELWEGLLTSMLCGESSAVVA